MQKLTLIIPDMHCSACIMRLEGIEDDLDGVASAQASYKKQVMEITFDERKLKVEDIIKAVRSLGYTPTQAGG